MTLMSDDMNEDTEVGTLTRVIRVTVTPIPSDARHR